MRTFYEHRARQVADFGGRTLRPHAEKRQMDGKTTVVFTAGASGHAPYGGPSAQEQDHQSRSQQSLKFARRLQPPSHEASDHSAAKVRPGTGLAPYFQCSTLAPDRFWSRPVRAGRFRTEP